MCLSAVSKSAAGISTIIMLQLERRWLMKVDTEGNGHACSMHDHGPRHLVNYTGAHGVVTVGAWWSVELNNKMLC